MKFVVSFFLLLGSSFAQTGTLHFVGVAYDESPPPGQTVDHYNYAADNFSQFFAGHSQDLFTEIKIQTLKGKDATREAVLSVLATLRNEAQESGFHLLGHARRHGIAGMERGLPGDGVIEGGEIKAELAKLPCPAIVALSTCGSGRFIRPSPREMDLPDNVAAFAACQRRQSTANELDRTLLEALSGFGDANTDGVVTLQEAIAYVPRRYQKLMRETGAIPSPCSARDDDVALDLPLAKVSGDYVAVVNSGAWHGAAVLEKAEDQVRVRYLGFDPGSRGGDFYLPDEKVDAKDVDFPGGNPAIEVEWRGQWYSALIRERNSDGRYRIHYVGYPESDDEVVGQNRVRYPFVRMGKSRNKDQSPHSRFMEDLYNECNER